jgi:prepilin-type N-terminal cleavage/methylation domain-containing protein
MSGTSGNNDCFALSGLTQGMQPSPRALPWADLLRPLRGEDMQRRAIRNCGTGGCASPSVASSGRRGMTLLEVLLVLAVLAIVAAMVWPMMDRPLAGWRLRRAADMVRTAWTRARNQAISSERVMEFQFSQGGVDFQVLAQGAAGSQQVSLDTATSESSADTSANPSPGIAKSRLPEGVTFKSGQSFGDVTAVNLDATGSSDGQGSISGEAAVMSNSSGSAQSILFYPDGSTSTAQLVLVNEHGWTIDVSLRGETGVATIGEAQAGQERTP